MAFQGALGTSLESCASQRDLPVDFAVTHLLRRQTQPLPLETRDPRPRQPAVPDPRVGVGPGIPPRHPPQELAVIDDEVRVGELMRVEEEGRDAETNDGDPEVDEMRDPDAHRDVE